jgi:hypothetical protein
VGGYEQHQHKRWISIPISIYSISKFACRVGHAGCPRYEHYLMQRGIVFIFVVYFTHHCFICRPSTCTVAGDAGIEPSTLTLAWHSDARLTTRPDLIHRLDLIHSARFHPNGNPVFFLLITRRDGVGLFPDGNLCISYTKHAQM